MLRRRNRRLGLAAAGLVVAAGVVAAFVWGAEGRGAVQRPGGNLVPNGGFEEPGAQGMPSAWFARLTNAPQELVSVGRAKGGYKSQWCLKLQSGTSKVLFGAYCQPIDIPPGAKELVVSFYYRTRDIPQPDVYVLVFNRNFAEREWETPYIQAADHPIPQSKDWALMGWRMRLLPGAKQALVAFRAAGRGELRVDDVGLRVYGDPVRCEVLSPGLISGLPSKRLLKMRLELADGWRRPIVGSLIVPERGRPKTIWRGTIKPGSSSGLVEVSYSLDYRKATPGTLVLASEEGEVFDIQQLNIPALLDGRVVKPAFRATLLKSLPCERIVAAGVINATAEIARRAKVSARIVGTSEEAVKPEGVRRPSEKEWEASFVPRDLLTGRYQVEVACQVDKSQYKLLLPLRVAPPQEAEAAYDDNGVMWVAGRPMLPRGIYFATTEREVENVKAAGYNFTIVPAPLASTRLMDKMQRLGLYAVVESRSMEFEQHSAWEHITSKYGAHKALLAWHIVPKPDAELTPPHGLVELREAIMGYDPHHPVVTSLTMPSLMRQYADVCDIALVWTDPIPESGVRTVGMLVDEARVALAPKPVWAVIQTIGHHWSWDRKLDPATDGRPPTPQEHRAMVYLALVHGARGVVNYTYVFEGRGRGANFRLDRDAPALWTATIRTNRELAWIEPYLVAGTWHPLSLSMDSDVHLAYWKTRDRLLLIAVNTADRPAAAAFRIPPVSSAMLTDVFTGEKVIGTAAGDFGVQLDGHGVAVLLGRLVAG